MIQFLCIILFLFCSPVYADLPEPDTMDFLDINGHKIYAPFIEECRDAKTGKFAKCPIEGSGNQGNIVKKTVKRCRDGATGRFVKCPK